MTSYNDIWPTLSGSGNDELFDAVSEPSSPMTSISDNMWPGNWLSKVHSNGESLDSNLVSTFSVPQTDTESNYFDSYFSSEFFSSACTTGTVSPIGEVDDSKEKVPNLNEISNKLEHINRAKDLSSKNLETIFDTKDVLKDSSSSSSTINCPKKGLGSIAGTQLDGCKKRRTSRKRLTESQKQAHNKIEKKYRININAKIAGLQKIIPAVALEKRAFETGMEDEPSDIENPRHKLNKSMILERAIHYILQLQDNKAQMDQENIALRQELLRLGGNPTSFGKTTI